MDIGETEHLVTFEGPDGRAVPDGDGGYVQAWMPLTPSSWYVRIRPASAGDAERTPAGSLITHVSYHVSGAFHPGVTTAVRMLYAGGVYQITSAVNVDMLGVDMELVADLQS